MMKSVQIVGISSFQFGWFGNHTLVKTIERDNDNMKFNETWRITLTWIRIKMDIKKGRTPSVRTNKLLDKYPGAEVQWMDNINSVSDYGNG